MRRSGWVRAPCSEPPPCLAAAGQMSADAGDALFGELDAKIEAGMARYHVPGAAVGCSIEVGSTSAASG